MIHALARERYALVADPGMGRGTVEGFKDIQSALWDSIYPLPIYPLPIYPLPIYPLPIYLPTYRCA